MLRILVVEDMPQYSDRIVRHFTETLSGYAVLCAENRDDALAILAGEAPDLLLLDLVIPASQANRRPSASRGEEVLAAARRLAPTPRVVVLSSEGHLAREYLVKLGVDDFFAKDLPDAWEREELPQRVEELIGHLACRSSAMQLLREQLGRTAESRVLLLTGPEGSGKRHLASILHRCSPARESTFCEVSLAGGSVRDMGQALRQDDPGSVLLTDVDHAPSLPAEAQTRIAALVRSANRPDRMLFLSSTVSPDELLTDADLTPELARELRDATHISVPPLADRLDDVPELAQVFCRAEAVKQGRKPLTLTYDASEALQYAVREGHLPGEAAGLRSVVTAAVGRAETASIGADDLSLNLPATHEAVMCVSGSVTRKRLSAPEVDALQDDAQLQLLMWAERDATGPVITHLELDGESITLRDHRLGRILALLAGQPGEQVSLADHRSTIGLLPDQAPRRYIYRLRQALGDTDVEGRSGRFIEGHHGQVYSFTTDVPFALLTLL